jgi:hypothetical protein
VQNHPDDPHRPEARLPGALHSPHAASGSAQRLSLAYGKKWAMRPKMKA